MNYRFRVFLVMGLIILSSLAVFPAHGGNAVVSDCGNFAGIGTISDAVATANSGGGTITFTCTGTITFTGALTITADVDIIGGAGIIFDGGNTTRLFIVDPGGDLTIDSLTLQNGNAATGGAIFNPSGLLTVTNSRLLNNTAASGGGAIYSTLNSTVSNSYLSGNASAGFGGAIYHGGIGDLTVNNNQFVSNFSDQGGAIFVAQAFAFISNSTFFNNVAVQRGGAIVNTGTMTVGNSTFYNNSAPLGGGFYQTVAVGMVSASMVHTTFVNNNATSGGAIQTDDANINVDYSIISGSGSQCVQNAPGTLNVPANNMTDNACMSATAVGFLNFGTFDGTVIPLLAGSLAIDNYTSCSVGIDQVGTARPQGAGCDLGAFEYIPSFTPLNASAVCIGNDLQVTINNGDGSFNITADSGTLASGVGLGTHTFMGPRNETNVTVTETTGDAETINLTNFNCMASTTLLASAVCVGNNLLISISNGDAPFQITASSGTLLTGLGLGTHIITGPVNETGVNVTELAGDTENFPLGNIVCSGAFVPVVPVTQVTVVGCALDSTDGVEVANAPDNTYCRVLMRNGSVVSFSGAIPADLIGLGVKLAVDVYRLEGGMSVNTFPAYARICLSGTGRYFYMDGRDAPRHSVEMPTEQLDGMTCAWIPAPGTVILTN